MGRNKYTAREIEIIGKLLDKKCSGKGQALKKACPSSKILCKSSSILQNPPKSSPRLSKQQSTYLYTFIYYLMRNKILMWLAFFGIFCQGWAQQVTDQSQLSNDKVYTITSARAFLLYSEKVPNQICGSTGTSVGTVTQDNTDPNQQFRIEKIGENYYLYSVGADRHRGVYRGRKVSE